MTRRTLLAIIILLAILGIVLWVQNRQSKKQAAVNPILSVSASKSSANPGDIIVYTLNVENPSDKVIEAYTVEANIADISQLANLIDAEGASFNPAAGSLIWTPVDIASRGLVQKQFNVKVKDQLASASDMVMKLKFGNEVTVALSRSQVAGETQGAANGGSGSRSPGKEAYRSPNSGPSGMLSILLALLTAIGYSLYRLKRS